nr:NADP-dependent malic enzyme-like [Tanacetum cinerariifolium]
MVLQKDRKEKLSKYDLEGPPFKVVKAFYENSISLQFQMEECHLLLTDQVDLVNPECLRLVPDVSKPLPLGGPPGQAALSMSKLKAANYPDFGLDELVPSLWIKSERDYNISASYGKLNHLPGLDKVHLYNAINLWIRSVFIRQRVRDLQLSIESYQTKLNHIEPRCDASDFLFKEDYFIVSKPTAVIYKDRNDQEKMLKENEVHKFSDGTLTRVLHKLDYMVKDFGLYQYNPGIENRIWSEDDKRRSEEFMEAYREAGKVACFDGVHIKSAASANKKGIGLLLPADAAIGKSAVGVDGCCCQKTNHESNDTYIFPGFGLGLIISDAIRVLHDKLLAACKFTTLFQM